MLPRQLHKKLPHLAIRLLGRRMLPPLFRLLLFMDIPEMQVLVMLEVILRDTARAMVKVVRRVQLAAILASGAIFQDAAMAVVPEPVRVPDVVQTMVIMARVMAHMDLIPIRDNTELQLAFVLSGQ